MASSHRRGPWSQAEDTYLMLLVQQAGYSNWVKIAERLGSRSPKQCRERYHQNLKPSLNHSPISPEEGAQIEALVAQHGKRWAEIARHLNGRSDNAVKNWWNGSQNRRKRMDRRRVNQISTVFDDPHSEYSPYPASHHHQHHYHQALPHSSAGVPRSLPPPISVMSSHARSAPPPSLNLSYDRSYGVETPLPSPSGYSAGYSPSTDSAVSPSTCSDYHYEMSPRNQHSSVELPPIRTITRDFSYSPRPSLSPIDAKLPGLSSLPSRLPPISPYASRPAASMWSGQPPAYQASPRAQLPPTAPSSPISRTVPAGSPRTTAVPPMFEDTKKTSRISLSSLLH